MFSLGKPISSSSALHLRMSAIPGRKARIDCFLSFIERRVVIIAEETLILPEYSISTGN